MATLLVTALFTLWLTFSYLPKLWRFALLPFIFIGSYPFVDRVITTTQPHLEMWKLIKEVIPQMVHGDNIPLLVTGYALNASLLIGMIVLLRERSKG